MWERKEEGHGSSVCKREWCSLLSGVILFLHRIPQGSLRIECSIRARSDDSGESTCSCRFPELKTIKTLNGEQYATAEIVCGTTSFVG